MKHLNYLANALAALTAAAAFVGIPGSAAAQQTATQYACYIPGSGTMYRIKESNTPTKCSVGHQEFVVGGNADATRSASAGAQKGSGSGGGGSLPTNEQGAFNFSNVNGFLSVGTPYTGNIPTNGAGTRFMWYPGKSALRAGTVNGSHWDNANVGLSSVAIGYDVKATGDFSAALGQGTLASHQGSIALGVGSTASGFAALASGSSAIASGITSTAFGSGAHASGTHSIAAGVFANASGTRSVAIGEYTTASGENSTAIGRRASTNGKTGTFIYGDASSASTVTAAANNQFAVRAQRFWFGNSNSVTATAGRFIETSTGAYLSSGGVWVSSSDSTRKHNWNEVDGEAVLAKLSTLPVRTWSYRAEVDSVRHMGPTAQDFRNAFGLGDSDKGIGSVDVDGVSLAGIKALIERTAQLQRENDDLRRDNAEVRTTVAELFTRITSLESAQR